jgi:16S rRNA (guanine966-N2)-methyltransferase
LRIIAGAYRGRSLKSPPSLDVRPTSDRLRETLFNILAPRIKAVRFLDLCAGSGAVGIEALSRGATHATFVDRSRKVCKLIEANISLLNIPTEQTNVIFAEAGDFAKRVGIKTGPWDILFFDPPYQYDYLKVLSLLGSDKSKLLASDGLLVVEHFHKNQLPEVIEHLSRTRVLKQGDSSLSFFERTP